MTIANLNELVSTGPLDGFRISERWGVVADPGYQALPDVLLYSQAELGLSSEELNVLLNLLAHWWRPKDVVFPRASTIADRMGVTQRTIQRITKSLEQKGFIIKSRTEDGRPYYDVTPVKEKLSPLAKKRLEEKRQLKRLREELSSDEDNRKGATEFAAEGRDTSPRYAARATTDGRGYAKSTGLVPSE